MVCQAIEINSETSIYPAIAQKGHVMCQPHVILVALAALRIFTESFEPATPLVRSLQQENQPNAEAKAIAALRATEPFIKVDATNPEQPVVAIHFRPNYGTVTDDDLVHLKAFTHLRSVKLPNKRSVTDAGLAHLTGLSHLVELNVNGTRVTPAGVV